MGKNFRLLDFTALEPKIQDAAKLMEMAPQPSRPAMSHPLRKLRDAKLVTTRRDAQTIFLTFSEDAVSDVLKVLHKLYCDQDSH